MFKRGGKLYAQILGANGKWQQVATGFSVGQEAEAEKWIADTRKQIARVKVGAPPVLTVEAFFDEWLPTRRLHGLDWKNDEGRFRIWLKPLIGGMPLADVEPKHLVTAFAKIRTTTSKATNQPPSPRQVYNIYSVCSALFRDAQLQGKTKNDPCKLTQRELGAKVDLDPEWREDEVFTRAEAVVLISDARIPPDRRIVYGSGILAGMRPGECSALRWRHYDPVEAPLGVLHVSLAYSSSNDVVRGTKTKAVRHVPVHPTFAAMLLEWREVGWPAMMGRPPTPDDLIVPLPPVAAGRRKSRTGDAHRSKDYNGKRWRETDWPMLGWRYRGPYATKSTFISLALADGARQEVIEQRVTHTSANKRSAFSGYVRGSPQWLETCGEVAKLVLHLSAVPVQGRQATVRADELWWRRRESNPGPKMRQD